MNTKRLEEKKILDENMYYCIKYFQIILSLAEFRINLKFISFFTESFITKLLFLKLYVAYITFKI